MRPPFREDTARYALYFTPPTHSLWWHAGCQWLGRNAAAPVSAPPAHTFTGPNVSGVDPAQIQALTASPRRYGFHATLKAPFRLAQGFTQEQLLSMVAAFARIEQPIVLPEMEVCLLDSYLALCPQASASEVNALAMRCVAHFDALRAAPDAAELTRRRQMGLSARQEKLLAQWGYPFTEELFRFHMTLTGNLHDVDTATVGALRSAATAYFQPASAAGAPVLDALTICIEAAPGEPFSILQRFPFAHAGTALPRIAASESMSGSESESESESVSVSESVTEQPGRLFYVVGPSGVGKDSLLQWLQQHLSENTRTVFARRAITREPHLSEWHEPIDADTFWEQVCYGEFSMFWQANGACYGVRREIEADMRAGRDVIVNGSRAYAPCVQQAFPEARIVWITADPETISKRLVARQRESGAALIERVSRATQYLPPVDENVIAIDNSGALEVAGAKLLALLQRT